MIPEQHKHRHLLRYTITRERGMLLLNQNPLHDFLRVHEHWKIILVNLNFRYSRTANPGKKTVSAAWT